MRDTRGGSSDAATEVDLDLTPPPRDRRSCGEVGVGEELPALLPMNQASGVELPSHVGVDRGYQRFVEQGEAAGNVADEGGGDGSCPWCEDGGARGRPGGGGRDRPFTFSRRTPIRPRSTSSKCLTWVVVMPVSSSKTVTSSIAWRLLDVVSKTDRTTSAAPARRPSTTDTSRSRSSWTAAEGWSGPRTDVMLLDGHHLRPEPFGLESLDE